MPTLDKMQWVPSEDTIPWVLLPLYKWRPGQPQKRTNKAITSTLAKSPKAIRVAPAPMSGGSICAIDRKVNVICDHPLVACS